MVIQKGQLAAMPRDKQVQLLHNTFKYMHGPNAAKQRKAQRLQGVLNEAWREDADAKLAEDKASGCITAMDTPTHGVLAAIGYRVGADGIPKNHRKELIKWVTLQNVPFVCTSAYMLQWGEPCSEKRFGKLENVLRQFIRNVDARPSYVQARGDWQSDLEFALVIKTLLGPNLRRANGR